MRFKKNFLKDGLKSNMLRKEFIRIGFNLECGLFLLFIEYCFCFVKLVWGENNNY